ncbi:MAG: RNA-binding cell elongation regulator Jag/EloR [Eubacteriales bacterium]
MTKQLEITGKTEEDAIEKALEQLKLDRDDISVEVLNRAKTGFLGIGSVQAKVRVSYEVEEPKEEVKKEEKQEEKKQEVKKQIKEEKSSITEAIEIEEPSKDDKEPSKEKKVEISNKSEEKQQKKRKEEGKADYSLTKEEVSQLSEKIEEYLNGLLLHLHVEAKPEVSFDGNNFIVNMTGENLGVLIGRRGETLDSIQQLTTYTLRRYNRKRFRIYIDAENFRGKRIETLEKLANKVAGQVIKKRKSVTLEPMNAYERHIIHMAVEDMPEITTYSVGQDPHRKIVIALKK